MADEQQSPMRRPSACRSYTSTPIASAPPYPCKLSIWSGRTPQSIAFPTSHSSCCCFVRRWSGSRRQPCAHLMPRSPTSHIHPARPTHAYHVPGSRRSASCHPSSANLSTKVRQLDIESGWISSRAVAQPSPPLRLHTTVAAPFTPGATTPAPQPPSSSRSLEYGPASDSAPFCY